MKVDTADVEVVAQADATLLVEAVRRTGPTGRCRRRRAGGGAPTAVHDPGRSSSVALGSDCLADIATLRAEPWVFGPVASEKENAAPTFK